MDNLAEKIVEQDLTPVDLKLVAEQLGAGELLRKARDKAGLTQTYIARRLNMAESAIAHIEAENFAALPSAIFVKGYLKNYAQCVGVKSEEVLAAYQRYLDAQQETPKLRKRERIKAATSDPVMRLLGILSVLLFVLTSVYFWNEQQAEELMPATEQVAVVEAGTVSGKTHIEAVDLSVSSESAKATPPEAALLVQFIDSSWLEVRDADDKVLFNGVKLAGEEVNLTSQSFFDVAIGNAAAVKLSYNSAPVDLSSATRSGDITNIELGLRQP